MAKIHVSTDKTSLDITHINLIRVCHFFEEYFFVRVFFPSEPKLETCRYCE